MIPAKLDSLHFSRRCVAARFHGRIPQLVEALRIGGFDVTETDIEDTAVFVGELLRFGDTEKEDCYLCSRPLEVGKLCSCFDEVTPQRHYNVNDVRLLGKLAPETVVETYCCEQCAKLDHVNAETALAIIKTHNAYKTRRYCGGCFEEKRRNRAARPRGGKKAAKQPAKQVPKQPPKVPMLNLLELASASVRSGQA